MPMPCHMTLEGETQGAIDGSCEMQGRENSILVYAMNHDIHIPRDPQTGLASGKRIHGPLTIVKEVDKSSPKLYQALCTGENMTNVELKYFRVAPDGTEEHYFTTTLENAIVVEMKPYMPVAFLAENEPYRHMEELSLTYRKIMWDWVPDGIGAEDDWMVPVE